MAIENKRAREITRKSDRATRWTVLGLVALSLVLSKIKPELNVAPILQPHPISQSEKDRLHELTDGKMIAEPKHIEIGPYTIDTPLIMTPPDPTVEYYDGNVFHSIDNKGTLPNYLFLYGGNFTHPGETAQWQFNLPPQSALPHDGDRVRIYMRTDKNKEQKLLAVTNIVGSGNPNYHKPGDPDEVLYWDDDANDFTVKVKKVEPQP